MIWTPEWIVEPAPMLTSSPMVASGWTSTSAASFAVGLTHGQRADADPAAAGGRGWKKATTRAKARWASSTWMAGSPAG